MVWGGLVETNRVGFCVLVYPRSSWREEREHSVDVCVCPPATSYSYFFYWLCGVGVGGPGAATGTAGVASVCYCIRAHKGRAAQEWRARSEPSEQLQNGRWGLHCLEHCSSPFHYSQAGSVCEQSNLIFSFLCVLSSPSSRRQGDRSVKVKLQ